MRQFHCSFFVLSVTSHLLFINRFVAAVALNLTDSSPHPRCYPTILAAHPLLTQGECRNAINEFQLKHLNFQYVLTHDPQHASLYSIVCPYRQFSGNCGLLIDYGPEQEENLQPNAAALEAMKVVNGCVGKPNVDGGAIYLNKAKVRLEIVALMPRSGLSGGVSGLSVPPVESIEKPSDSMSTS